MTKLIAIVTSLLLASASANNASIPIMLKERGISVAASTRIIGGTETDTNRFPYAVSLQYSGEHFCGGSLIGPDVVLTAGHCNGEYSLGGISYNVVIGRRDLNKFWTGESIKMIKEIRHPQYVDETVDNDFNLVFLSRKVSLEGVEYVQLNTNGTVPSDEGDNVEELTVIGWGDTDSSDDVAAPSDVLMETQLYPISNKDCASSQGLVNTEFGPIFTDLNGGITENMVCAKANGKDACQGDSGGPLVIKGDTDTGANDVQVGIVSWGLGCADKDFPGVYSRISAQYQWIQEQVCTWSMDPPDNFDCSGIGNTPTEPTSPPIVNKSPKPTASPTKPITLSPTTPLTEPPTRSPLPDGQTRLLIDIELDGKPSDTGWKISSIPDDKILYEVAVGVYDSSMAGKELNYEVVVDPEQFYRLSIYDASGDGFSGHFTIYDNIISDDTKLAHEPGFSEVSGTEIHHGFYAGDSPGQFVTLHFKFDYFAQEVAYELKSLTDDVILALAWFGTYEPSDVSATEQIPIFGPERGDQSYRLTVWDSGGDGIAGQYGNGKYELYLGKKNSNNLLTSGGNFAQKEIYEFIVPGDNGADDTTNTLIPTKRPTRGPTHGPTSKPVGVQFPTNSPVWLPLPLEFPRYDQSPSQPSPAAAPPNKPLQQSPTPTAVSSTKFPTKNGSAEDMDPSSRSESSANPVTQTSTINKSTSNIDATSSNGGSGRRNRFISQIMWHLTSALVLSSWMLL